MKLVLDFIIMVVKLLVVYKVALLITRVITGHYTIKYLLGRSKCKLTKAFAKLKGVAEQ